MGSGQEAKGRRAFWTAISEAGNSLKIPPFRLIGDSIRVAHAFVPDQPEAWRDFSGIF